MTNVRFAGIAEVKKNLALAAKASMRASEAQALSAESHYIDSFVSKGEMQAHLKAAVIDPSFDRFMKHNEHYLKEPVDVTPQHQTAPERFHLKDVFSQPERLGMLLNPEQTQDAFKNFMSSLGTLLKQPENLGVKVYYNVTQSARFLESLEQNFKKD